MDVTRFPCLADVINLSAVGLATRAPVQQFLKLLPRDKDSRVQALTLKLNNIERQEILGGHGPTTPSNTPTAKRRGQDLEGF